MSMDGKVALVTGAAQGLGRDSALAFAAAGARVVVADLDPADETVAAIEQAGGTATYVRADVTVEREVEAMIAFAVDTFGGLDCAHNNAGGGFGVPADRPLQEYSERDWDFVVDLNLKGTFLCLKHELRHMVGRGRGAVVNTASAAAYRGSIGPPAYTAAKHGVVGLTKRAAIEVAAAGIRVNAVCPGYTMTQRKEPTRDASAQVAEANMPVRRILVGREIADTAVWLCSDAASALTGALVPADGGLSAV